MNVFQAAVLGIVQGLTEFLPVSSSGHLVLFQQIMGIEGDALFFDTMLHLGTLAAVVVVLWKDIISILRHPLKKPFWVLVVATVPAVVATLLFGDFFEGAYSGQYLSVGFLFTALLLCAAELVNDMSKKKLGDVGYSHALIIGGMQAVAILPGVSRSGSTLVGGLFCGLERSKAANFAFLMSIPVILGSVVYQGYDVIKTGAIDVGVAPTIVGMVCAGVSGFFAVKFMLNLVRKHKLYGFAIYVAILGVLVLTDQLFTNVLLANPF